MFEKNMLTFNPGWEGNAIEVDAFDAIRSISLHFTENETEPQHEVWESHQGPVSVMVSDPDGI
jgi:lactoylglutathione lyase